MWSAVWSGFPEIELCGDRLESVVHLAPFLAPAKPSGIPGPMPDHDASDGTRDRLSPEMLLYGFVRAVGRFTRSGLSEEALTGSDDAPDLDHQVLAAEWETAVFEALSWSVTLDERLRHDFDGTDWTAEFEGGGVVRALRYARNCIHHNWVAALDVGLEPDELVASHATVFGITWANELHSDRPDRRGTAAYAEALAGRNVGDTLMAAVKVYEEGVRSLVGMGATLREGAAPKPLVLYHCVYSKENFNDAAHALFDLVAYAHRTFPGAERHLFVDIEGHRMPNDAFDGDMFELQKDFLLGYLMHFLTEARVPLIHVRNPNSQQEDLPDELHIYAASNEPPNDSEL